MFSDETTISYVAIQQLQVVRIGCGDMKVVEAQARHVPNDKGNSLKKQRRHEIFLLLSHGTICRMSHHIHRDDFRAIWILFCDIMTEAGKWSRYCDIPFPITTPMMHGDIWIVPTWIPSFRVVHPRSCLFYALSDFPESVFLRQQSIHQTCSSFSHNFVQVLIFRRLWTQSWACI